MNRELTDMFGIEYPIFAFSHCRDVVAAVTNAGGMGVLGALAFSPEQLELELKWIDEHVNGRPYGVDVVMPVKTVDRDAGLSDTGDIGAKLREYISQEPEPFDGREALHTKLKAKWDGVPMLIDVYVLSKDGCVYDFVYLAPAAAFDGGAPAFETFVRGFRTLPGSGAVSYTHLRAHET